MLTSSNKHLQQQPHNEQQTIMRQQKLEKFVVFINFFFFYSVVGRCRGHGMKEKRKIKRERKDYLNIIWK